MIILPNGCYCSDLKVHPKNWKTTKASPKVQWYVYYRFYDPSLKDSRYGKGILIRIKRMNKFSTIQDRQAETQKCLLEETNRLKAGFHPAKEKGTKPLPIQLITPYTPFLDALKQAEPRIEGSKSTKRDLRSILNFVSEASYQLQLSEIPVTSISRKHIKLLLNQIEANQEKESFHRFNKIRSYLMILFNELVELEAVDSNPVREIAKKQAVKPVRKLLSIPERQQIDQYLHLNHYRFWLFIHIFFHSGSRLTEIMQVRLQDINLEQQVFIVTIRKGKMNKQVVKPIKDVALPFWLEAVKGAIQTDYIFSTGLEPGPLRIDSSQITRRWNTHVKSKLGIQGDLYSLKHLNLDEIAALLTLEDAAAMASHTSTAITSKYYALGEKQRQNDRLKRINNSFS